MPRPLCGPRRAAATRRPLHGARAPTACAASPPAAGAAAVSRSASPTASRCWRAIAAGADAAATVIANAVDVEWPGIQRAAANQLTRRHGSRRRFRSRCDVPPLPPAAVRTALARGRGASARRCRRAGLISAAALVCQEQAAVLSAARSGVIRACHDGSRTMIEIRRVLTQVEDIVHEFGPPAGHAAAPRRNRPRC